MGRQLFPGKTIPEIPLAGRIKIFLELWKFLTKGPSIWTECSARVQSSAVDNLHQKNVPRNNQLSKAKIKLLNLETSEMLKKGAISTV